MKASRYIIIFIGAWMVLGIYACKTPQTCDCNFGHHATGKSGVYKTHSKNH